MSRPPPAGSPATSWARDGRSCSCTASMRPVPGSSSRRWRRGWPGTDGSCSSTGSDSAHRIGPTCPTAGPSTASSSSASGLAALQPGETAVDVVALSLPGQYVVVAAAEHPERFGRIVLISPTGFGRFKGTPAEPSRNHPPVPAPDGDRSAAVRGPRSAPGDPLVPPADLRRSGAGPTRVRAILLARTCQQPGAYRAPLAFVSGLLNDPRAEGAYKRLANPTLLAFGIIRASPTPWPRKRSSPRTAT